MLGERIEKYNTKVYLVNTGWTGGPYGVGSRMKLKYTRAMVTAALNGTFDDVEYLSLIHISSVGCERLSEHSTRRDESHRYGFFLFQSSSVLLFS